MLLALLQFMHAKRMACDVISPPGQSCQLNMDLEEAVYLSKPTSPPGTVIWQTKHGNFLFYVYKHCTQSPFISSCMISLVLDMPSQIACLYS